jgi:hypothetical protein
MVIKKSSVENRQSRYNEYLLSRVEAGSNTSTVTLRVVGGDEKGSLKSETIKYGREFPYDCSGEGKQHIQKTDPSSRHRGRSTKARP